MAEKGRGRPQKFPELRNKVRDALVFILSDGKAKGSPELKDALQKKYSDFNISQDELNEIIASWSNYITWVIDQDSIESLGKKRGYRIRSISEESISIIQPIETVSISTNNYSDIGNENRQNWESYLHLPVTLLMASKYGSHIVSLPSKTVSGKWTNPDMIMVRSSRFVDDDDDIFGNTLQLVDSTPRYIVSSIELKYGLGTSRTTILNALAEAAVNGGWANENWLLFADATEGKTDFDEDALSYATDNGVGIARIIYDDHDLRLELITRPILRTTLRLSSEFNRNGKKETLAKLIVDAIKHFHEKKSYRYVTRDTGKIAQLLLLAYQNLSSQPSFIVKDTDEMDKKAREIFALNRAFAKTLNSAILQYIPVLIEETGKIDDLSSFLKDELDQELKSQEKRRVETLLGILKM